MNNELINKNKYIIIAIILIFGVGAGVSGYLKNKNEANPTLSVSPTTSTSSLNSPAPTPTSLTETGKNITYTTFSSPKADFTFEYPNTWVYDEIEVENTIVWDFYSSPEKNPPSTVLEVHFPTYEGVSFCEIDQNGIKTPSPYQPVTFSTNDPKTYITYEYCGTTDYIYWQKGKRFTSASEIKDIHKTNLMLFYSNSSFDSEMKKGMEISQHIAQSIKMK